MPASKRKAKKITIEPKKSSNAGQHICSFFIICSFSAVFLLHLLSIVYLPFLHHDVAGYLTAGQMLVGGARPYVDIIDTNFPMIMYISAIPAWISSLTHAPLATAGIVFFFCTVLFTMLFFVKILKIAFPELAWQQLLFVCTAWLYSSCFTYWFFNFGQREQLIFLFLAPFFVLRHARYAQVRVPLYLSTLIALIAFCGVAIKPFYILPILAVELLHALAYRRFLKPLLSPETRAFVFAGIVYLAHFYFFAGMSAFYDYWLGFMMRGYIRGTAYAIGAESSMQLLQQKHFIYAYCGVAAVLSLLILYNRRSLFLLATCFGWFACVTVGFFIGQKKGWPYHLLPFYCSCYMGGALLCLACRKSFDKIKGAYMPVLAAAAVIMVLSACPMPFMVLRAALVNAPFHFEKNELVKTIESLTGPDDGVLFLDTATRPGFPALTYAGRKLGGRFLTTFPLAFFFKDSDDYVPKKELREDEAKFYGMLEKDIDVFRPKLIFVRTGQLLATDDYFRLHEYLSRRGFLKKIFSSYTYMGLFEGTKFVEDARFAESPKFELWRYTGNDATKQN